MDAPATLLSKGAGIGSARVNKVCTSLMTVWFEMNADEEYLVDDDNEKWLENERGMHRDVRARNEAVALLHTRGEETHKLRKVCRLLWRHDVNE